MNTIDWKNLPFGYFKTDYNVRCYYKDGKWGEIEVTDSENITMHMAATCLHYGQEAFEGMKAFTGKDGKIRIFRLEENAKRMIKSAQGVMMAEVPVELFTKVVLKAVHHLSLVVLVHRFDGNQDFSACASLKHQRVATFRAQLTEHACHSS